MKRCITVAFMATRSKPGQGSGNRESAAKQGTGPDKAAIREPTTRTSRTHRHRPGQGLDKSRTRWRRKPDKAEKIGLFGEREATSAPIC